MSRMYRHTTCVIKSPASAGVGATLARKTPASRRGPEATEGASRDHVRSTSACLGKRSLLSQLMRHVALVMWDEWIG